MRSTFHGFETARRAMMTQQAALLTTGHNIANANTEGFSRQRVNFDQTHAFPSSAMNSPKVPGQMGTGVQAGTIQRVREGFLDVQFRMENNKVGYWDARHVALEKMEDILNEPSEEGIANQLDRFWTALQDLSVHPEDSGARSVVRQRGLAVAETFRYTSDSLKAIQRDIKTQINVNENELNSIIRQINTINTQIGAIEPHGYLPNDLYDQRDLLIDQLSQFVNIKVERVPSGGMAHGIAEGKFSISLVDSNGNDLGIKLIDGASLQTKSVKVNYDETTGLVSNLTFSSANESITIEAHEFTSSGKLKGNIEAYGYMEGDQERGLYPEMLHNLDLMVFTFVEEFNAVHRAGWNLNEIETGIKNGVDFFSFSGDPAPTADNFQGAASRLQLSNEVRSGLNNIAAGANVNGQSFPGDGTNALALANVKDRVLNYGGINTNIQSFYQGIIGDMAVNTSEASRMKRNSETLRMSVEQRRQSVSSVSLDEEMTNMIKFQHAYNAAAKNIQIIDEMLERIINLVR